MGDEIKKQKNRFEKRTSQELDWEDSSSDTTTEVSRAVNDAPLETRSSHQLQEEQETVQSTAKAEPAVAFHAKGVTANNNGVDGTAREVKEKREKKKSKGMRQSRSTDDFKEFNSLQPLSKRTITRAAVGSTNADLSSPHVLNWSEALLMTASCERPAASPSPHPSLLATASGVTFATPSPAAPTSPSPRALLPSPAPERNKIRALFSSMVIGFKGDSTARVTSLFGVSLDELALRTRVDVPPPIAVLVSTLHTHLHTEGLFRVSASVPDVAELRGAAEKGALDVLINAEPHALAGLLTAFLIELPEPLIPFACYDDALAAAALPEFSARTAIAAVLARIPRAPIALLRMLVHLWQAIEHESAVNKMAAANLAVVFGPLILRSRKDTLDMRRLLQQNSVVECLIRSSIEDLFGSSTAQNSPQQRNSNGSVSPSRAVNRDGQESKKGGPSL